MIHLDLKISSNTINSDAMEKIRVALRQEMLAVIFKVVNSVADQNEYSFSSKDVHVDGSIKQID
jgi:septum formation topological specificity factor MinE